MSAHESASPVLCAQHGVPKGQLDHISDEERQRDRLASPWQDRMAPEEASKPDVSLEPPMKGPQQLEARYSGAGLLFEPAETLLANSGVLLAQATNTASPRQQRQSIAQTWPGGTWHA